MQGFAQGGPGSSVRPLHNPTNITQTVDINKIKGVKKGEIVTAQIKPNMSWE